MKYLLLLILLILQAGFSFAQDKPDLHVGGALRFNYNLSSWKEGQKARGGDFGYDFFRVNVKAAYKGLMLNTEYRHYSNSFGGGMLKQGWVAYDFNEKAGLQAGLSQVPFGITQYNSNNWFFNMTYYLGLEDDHDMGIKYSFTGEKWEYRLAFFKNAEELAFGSFSDASDSRYSYDVSSIDADGDGNLNFRNKEVNQFNGKLAFKWGQNGAGHKTGLSLQYGGLYNLSTGRTGYHYAYAFHYELTSGRINLRAQLAGYGYEPESPPGERRDMVSMTAYGAPYLIAAQAGVYTLCLSYSLPVDMGPVSNLLFYNDFGFLDKKASGFADSFMNVTGMLISAGNVFTYIDAAAGKNHPWLGPEWTNALAGGNTGAEWHLRFNINLGYYF